MKFMAASAISYSTWHAQLAIWELKTEKTKETKILKKKLLRLTKAILKIWTKKKKQIKKTLVKRKEKSPNLWWRSQVL